MLATRGGPAALRPYRCIPHSVAVIDPADARVVDDVLVGDYPTAFAADGSYVYVVEQRGSRPSLRSTPRRERCIDTFSLSRAIDLVAVGGHLWAANGGAPGHTPFGVGPGTILDYGPVPTLHTLRVGPNIEGGSTAARSRRPWPPTVRTLAIWAGNQDSRTVSEIDTSLERIVQTIRGIAPGGLAAVGNSNGDTVWASDPARGLVVRIDGNARRVVRRIRCPAGRRGWPRTDQAVWVIAERPRRVALAHRPANERRGGADPARDHTRSASSSAPARSG